MRFARSSLIALCLAACGAPGPAREARIAPPPASSAIARVDAALAAPPSIPFSMVEVLAPLQSSAPSAIAVNPPAPGTIQMSDDVFPQRLLVPDDAPVETDAIARSLAPCFAKTANAISIVSLELSVPPTAHALATAPSEIDRCVETRLPGAIWRSPPLHLQARFSATGIASRAPRGANAIQEDLGEVEQRLATATTDDARDALGVLAGSLHLELALATDRGAERDRARRIFATVSAQAATRAAALFGTAVALDGLDPKLAVVAYRALVCRDHYTTTSPLGVDQDHPAEYWDAWETVHRTPISSTVRPRGPFHALANGPERWDEETQYRSPYDGCVATPGAEHEWLAEAWRAIGRYHEHYDSAGGPFSLKRAATAYTQSLAEAPSPFVRLALGRVLYRTQRYRAATQVLGEILRELDGSANQASAELHLRASQIYASSLTYGDFDGGAPTEPFVSRPDVIDTEPNPSKAQAKLGVVFDRLADPTLVPPAASYAPLLVFWSAWELSQLGMYELAARGMQMFLERWPLHRDAPVASWERVHALDAIRLGFKPATPEALRALQVANDARDQRKYGRPGPWTTANANDSEAIARAMKIAANGAPR